MKNICETDRCSGCNACLNVCGKSAVKRILSARGEEINVIDENLCIDCGLCQRVCPQNSESALNMSRLCVAAWSLNDRIRKRSASGGVAAELYKWAVANNIWISGVRMTDDLIAEHYLTKDINALGDFQNSKYVYSDTKFVFKQIVEKLKNEEGVLFIGLPCQCDALKALCDIKRISVARLYIVDLICHGTAPQTYLREHVSDIEKRKKRKADKLFFRDPDTYTYTFTFTLKNNGVPFYRKKVDRDDYYQIGYHKGIIYRENCYACKYAQKDRVGDLTLADFSYVGAVAPCDYDNKNVSCVLVNTNKGENLLNRLVEEQRLFAEERPMQEEIEYEHMLHKPTAKPKERAVFIKFYTAEHAGFEDAMAIACKKIALENEIRHYFHIQDLRKIVSRAVPTKLKAALKKR